MEHDELCSLYVDSQPTVADVVRVQLTKPIGLEPPVYHILSHFAMDLFGKNSFALRLPALTGFILMDVCLYFLILPLSTKRAALIAMLIPIATGAFPMAFWGRPYGLLLGLYAASLLCWQAAIKGSERQRILPLLGLSLCIVLAINSHYFGVFVLIPLCVGEFIRYLKTRTPDLKMACSILLGGSSLLLVLPFVSTTKIYQGKVYGASGIRLNEIAETYRTLLLPGVHMLHSTAAHILFSVIVVIALFFVLRLSFQNLRFRFAEPPWHEWAAFISCAALPVFGAAFGVLVTHTYQGRYVIGCFVGVVALLALAIERGLRSNSAFYGALAAIVLFSVVYNAYSANDAYQWKLRVQSTQESPEVRQFLDTNPDAQIYIQAGGPFLQDTYYCTDRSLVTRFHLLYGQAEELHWKHILSQSIEAVKLTQISQLHAMSYDQFRALPNGQAVLIYKDEWQWIEDELQSDGAKVVPIGALLGGEVYVVTFHEVQ
jgi:hypothetical protein